MFAGHVRGVLQGYPFINNFPFCDGMVKKLHEGGSSSTHLYWQRCACLILRRRQERIFGLKICPKVAAAILLYLLLAGVPV
jgi:hypothetical protein